jgi:hypothetical protein
MTHKTVLFLAAAVLASIAGMSQCVYAQAFDKSYVKSITLAGSNGTDLTNTVTFSVPTLGSSVNMMFPALNASGVLQMTNTTTGGCSWTIPAPIAEITPGSANTFSTTSSTSVVGWTTFATDGSLTGNGISTNLALNLAHSNLWTSAQTISISSIATKPLDAMLLENTTAATSGVQEYSPRIHFTGQGWGGSSESADWIVQAVPVFSSTSPTSSYLDFEHSLNGGAYASGLDIYSSGGATLGVASPSDPGSGILNVGTGLQIGGAAGSGKVLVGNGTNYVASTATYPTAGGGAGNVIWSNATGGFTAAAPYTNQWSISSNPTGTSSKTGVMMGLGSTAQFTPAGSGVVLILMTGNMSYTPTSDNDEEVSAQIYFADKSVTPVPGNGVIPVGTAVGSNIKTVMANGNNQWFFSCNAIVGATTALTVGHTYWVDAVVAAPWGTVTAAITNVVISVVELE